MYGGKPAAGRHIPTVSTYRERREAKVERLGGWAGKRETAAAQTLQSLERYTGDYAFNTQPGSFPLRRRVIRQEDRAFESLRKAQGMRSRAAGIQSQLAGAIYSDDPDAIPALERQGRADAAERPDPSAPRRGATAP